MKKQLIGILAALTCFACLGGCLKDTAAKDEYGPTDSITSDEGGSSEKPDSSTINLKAAKAVLKGMYDQEIYSNNNVDFEVTKLIPNVQGVDYTVSWSVDVTEGVVLEDKGDVVKVNVNEASTTAINYVLTATITAPDGSSDTQNFRFTVKAISQYVTATITDRPAENTAYKFHVYQSTVGKDLYFAGDTDSYYLASTEDIDAATKIYAEHVEGSDTLFNLTFTDASGVKMYLGIKNYYSNGKWRAGPCFAPTMDAVDGENRQYAFSYNADHGIIVATIEGYKSGTTQDVTETTTEDFYLGNYSTYTTIQASNISYLTDGSTGNNAGSLVGLVDRTTVPDADKVADSVKTLTVAPAFVAGGSIELAERGNMYPEATIAWSSDSNLVTVNGSTVAFANVDATTEVVLKATVACGSESQVVEFPVKVVPHNAAALNEVGVALGDGVSFGNTATLTGVVTKVDTAYDSEYGNVSVYVNFDGTEMLCYRITGTGANELAAGYTVTITGIITNFKGNAQFAAGSTIDNFVYGEAPDDGGNEGGETVVGSYTLSFADSAQRTTYTTEQQVWEQNGVKLTNNKASSTTNVADYANPARFYKNSEVIIEYPGMTKLVIDSAKNYDDKPYLDYFTGILPAGTSYTVDGTTVTIVFATAQDSFSFTCSAGQVRFYSITVSATEGGESGGEVTPPTTCEHDYVDGVCSKCGEEDPSYTPGGDESGESTAVVPEAGKPYIFGMTQGNLDNAIYYLVGGMDGYYMATTTDASAAIDTYIEATEGGYYFYTLNADGSKLYINMVVSGTHVNGAYEATASTVYTIDEEHHTLIAVVNDTEYWFATRNDKSYTTMGPCAVSYNGFYGEFYGEAESDGGEEECTHNYEPVVTDPTCTEAGYTTHTCSLCGDSYKADEVAATGHSYNEGVVTTEPTLNSTGVKTYTCSACGDSYTEDLPMLEGAAAEVNGVKYATFAEALVAAEAGSTITLTNSVSASDILVIDKAITIDGNGKSILSTGARAINVDCAGDVAIKNLNVVVESGCTRGINIINQASNVTLENVNISFNVTEGPLYGVHIATSATGANLTLTNCDVSAWGAVAVYGNNHNVVINDSTLVGTNVYSTDSNSFTTIAIGGDNINLTVNGGSVKAITQGTQAQFIIGARTDSTTNSTVKVNATTIELEGDHAYYVGMDDTSTNAVYFPVAYSDTLSEAGYCVTADEANEFVLVKDHSYENGYCACGATDPDYYFPVSITEALSATVGTKVEISGTVSSLYEEWSSYGNMSPYITDGTATILVFRTTTKVAIGDVITVKGVIGTYKDVNQIAKDGLTVEITQAHTCDYAEATCKVPATCTLCGTAKDDVLSTEHNYVNGVCSVCNGVDPSYEGEVVKVKDITLSFASTNNRTSFDTSSQVWATDGVTLTNNKGSSTSNVADYSAPARFYKSSELIIDCTDMTKIVFNCNTASYATALQNSIAAADNVTVSVDGKVVTVVFTEAVDSFTISTLSAQVRMDSIVVTAKA